MNAVWAELLISDTAEVLARLDDANWKTPVLTRNRYGSGLLTYEAAVLSDALQREVVREALQRAGIPPDEAGLPAAVRVRHGRNRQGRLLHYCFNFSGVPQAFPYPHAAAVDLLTGAEVGRGARVALDPWSVAILAEQ